MHNHKRSLYEIQKFSCLSNEKASNLGRRCKDFVIYILGAICTCILIEVNGHYHFQTLLFF